MTQQPAQKGKKKPIGAAAAAEEPAEQQPVVDQQQQQQRGRKKKGSNPWSQSAGWKTVDINDEFMLGADEFGFAGLEVLEDASLIDPAILASLDAAAQQQAEDEMPQTKKGKKQQQPKQQQPDKKRKHSATAIADADAAGAGDVGALKARLQKLEAENRALKKQRKPTAAAGDGNIDEAAAAAAGSEPAAADAAKQQRKQAKKQQRLEKLRQKRDLLKQQRREQQQQEAAQRQQEQEQVPDIDMSAWERFDLHPELVKALARQGFSAPTPIQGAVLEPAIRDRRDVIGAAQTGSGKTLAFGLPILQVLLQEREQEQLAQQLQQDLESAEGPAAAAAAAAATGNSSQQQGKQAKGPLRALILTPTRELALQVCEHLQALGKQVGLRVIALVGGIAPVKQERMLRSCPPVVVATPGRLWDLITHGNQHLSHLDDLSFFVLDEADRMVQQGHYQELSSILELLPTAERFAAIAASAEAEAAAAAEAAETAAAVDERERRKQQPGSKRQQQQQQQDGDAAGDSDQGDGEGVNDSQGSGSQSEEGDGSQSDEGDSESEEDAEESEEDEQQEQEQQQQQQGRKGQGRQLQLQQQRQRQRRQQRRGVGAPRKGLQVKHHLLQTFVFSATLALPAQLHKRLRKGGGGSSGAASLESLMDRICFRPRPAIVDLSPSTRLAERVVEGVVTTLEDERDAVLYYLLARHPGRALVFVNAVSAVRRLAALLQLLGLPAAALHAQQQQRQRLKALDRFKASPHGVLVATDVAARGLDVPGVQMVVHYQLPASADTYIHRSGRTARTGGNDGVALALVTPSDHARWAALRKALQGQPSPPSFPVDDRVLRMAQQRVALAAKIDSIQRKDRKTHADSTWARSNAEALGVALSDDPGDEGMADLQHGAIKASAAAAGGGSAAAGGRRGKKRKQDALAAAAAGLDGDSQAGSAGVAGAKKLAQGMAALQRQLTGMLAVPLQPSISSKYFTGGVSRAAAVAAAAAAAGDGQPGSSAAAAVDGADGAAVVEGGEAAAGELKPHTVLPAQTIAETIQLAARLKHSKSGQVAAAGGSGSSLVGLQRAGRAGKGAAAAGAARDDGSKARRKAAAEAAAAALRGGVLLPPKKQKKKKVGLQQQAGGVVKPTGLARLLMSKNEVKRLKKQQGMFVVRPGAAAFGRDAQGASALDVLTTAAQRH